METILRRPTVKDIMEKLAQYPPDTPFRIEDADTSLTIEIIHFNDAAGELLLSGDYDEMVK